MAYFEENATISSRCRDKLTNHVGTVSFARHAVYSRGLYEQPTKPYPSFFAWPENEKQIDNKSKEIVVRDSEPTITTNNEEEINKEKSSNDEHKEFIKEKKKESKEAPKAKTKEKSSNKESTKEKEIATVKNDTKENPRKLLQTRKPMTKSVNKKKVIKSNGTVVRAERPKERMKTTKSITYEDLACRQHLKQYQHGLNKSSIISSSTTTSQTPKPQTPSIVLSQPSFVNELKNEFKSSISSLENKIQSLQLAAKPSNDTVRVHKDVQVQTAKTSDSHLSKKTNTTSVSKGGKSIEPSKRTQQSHLNNVSSTTSGLGKTKYPTARPRSEPVNSRETFCHVEVQKPQPLPLAVLKNYQHWTQKLPSEGHRSNVSETAESRRSIASTSLLLNPSRPKTKHTPTMYNPILAHQRYPPCENKPSTEYRRRYGKTTSSLVR